MPFLVSFSMLTTRPGRGIPGIIMICKVQWRKNGTSSSSPCLRRVTQRYIEYLILNYANIAHFHVEFIYSYSEFMLTLVPLYTWITVCRTFTPTNMKCVFLYLLSVCENAITLCSTSAIQYISFLLGVSLMMSQTCPQLSRDRTWNIIHYTCKQPKWGIRDTPRE